ncbi:MAG TPA: hypothetical protein VJ692_10795, partial [Nitrospiraceae bacterium]|nr:hypothetical protein [Nitrospiraceae bacterium]
AVAFGGKAIRHADLESLLGAVPREQVRALISAVIAQDSPAALRIIAQLLECGHDLRAYCSEFVEHVRNLLVASVVPGTPAADGCRHLHGLIDLADEDLRQIVADAKGLTADQLQELFRIFSQAEDAIRASPHPRFMLEAAAVRATRLWGSSTVSRATGESLNDPKSSVRHERTSPPQAAGPTSTVASLSSPAMAKPTRVSSPHDEPATSAPASFDSPPSQSAARASTSIDQPTHAVPAPAQSPAGPLGEPQSARPSQESTVADVTLVWEQVVDRVERRHPSIGAFLATGTLLTIEGNQVTVGYPKTASIALTRIQKEETLQMVSGICTELAGRSVRLRVVELIEGQTAPPSLVQLRAAKKQSHKQSQLDQARSHPLVKQALEIFGGDVIEVRQTAPQEETR